MYGRKGGEGPNTGKKATTYTVTFPDGTTATKRDFNPPVKPVGYVYKDRNGWCVAAISEPDNPRLVDYVQCPAVVRE